jgi:hypothetical protein
MGTRGKRIRHGLGLGGAMDEEFCRRGLLEDHPLAGWSKSTA